MQEIVVASHETLQQALKRVSSCKRCNTLASIEFRLVINYIRHVMPTTAEFCQTEPARCPNCGEDIWEKTLVKFEMNCPLAEGVTSQHQL
jgi:hypothetical protein